MILKKKEVAYKSSLSEAELLSIVPMWLLRLKLHKRLTSGDV